MRVSPGSGISLYGYCKRVAALVSLRDRRESVSYAEASVELAALISRAHEPATWAADVAAKRVQSQFQGT